MKTADNCQEKYVQIQIISVPACLQKKTKKIIIIKYSVEVKVSFIDFLPLTNKDAESPTDIILSQITADGLYIQDCRG